MPYHSCCHTGSLSCAVVAWQGLIKHNVAPHCRRDFAQQSERRATTCSKAALVCHRLLQHNVTCPGRTLLCQRDGLQEERCLTCSLAASLCQLPPLRRHPPAARWTLPSSQLQPAVHLSGALTERALCLLAQPQGGALPGADRQRAGLGVLRDLQSR